MRYRLEETLNHQAAKHQVPNKQMKQIMAG